MRGLPTRANVQFLPLTRPFVALFVVCHFGPIGGRDIRTRGPSFIDFKVNHRNGDSDPRSWQHISFISEFDGEALWKEKKMLLLCILIWSMRKIEHPAYAVEKEKRRALRPIKWRRRGRGALKEKYGEWIGWIQNSREALKKNEWFTTKQAT